MINRKILASLVVIGVIGAVAGSGTLAYFSDIEESSGNTFEAGSINAFFGSFDSPINLQEDESLDDYFSDGEDETVIEVEDMKPGDTNETTVALAVTDNPSYVCMAVTGTEDDENQQIEPEEIAGDSSEDEGELSDYLELTVWVDDGDNKYQQDEKIIRGSEEKGVSAPTSPQIYELVDSDFNAFGNEATLQPGEIKYMAANVTLPFGHEDVNKAQTDRYTADLALYAVQARNNEDFQCDEDVDLSELQSSGSQ